MDAHGIRAHGGLRTRALVGAFQAGKRKAGLAHRQARLRGGSVSRLLLGFLGLLDSYFESTDPTGEIVAHLVELRG